MVDFRDFLMLPTHPDYPYDYWSLQLFPPNKLALKSFRLRFTTVAGEPAYVF